MKLPDHSEIDKDGRIYLKGINLEDSWLLEMNYNPEEKILRLTVDLSIWPESIYYETPLAGEWTCYKKTEISFVGIGSIIGLFNLEDIKPSIDRSGEKDWDCIYGLRMEDQKCKFEICDREIILEATELKLTIE
jgi:hypothetical protein